MRYEELQEEAEYLASTDADMPYDKDVLQDVYNDPQGLVEDDEIADWEEGMMLGEDHAYA